MIQSFKWFGSVSVIRSWMIQSFKWFGSVAVIRLWMIQSFKWFGSVSVIRSWMTQSFKWFGSVSVIRSWMIQSFKCFGSVATTHLDSWTVRRIGGNKWYKYGSVSRTDRSFRVFRPQSIVTSRRVSFSFISVCCFRSQSRGAHWLPLYDRQTETVRVNLRLCSPEETNISDAPRWIRR